MNIKSTTALKRLGLLCLISAANSAVSAAPAPPSTMVTQSMTGRPGLSYSDMVDLADAAPMVANIRITKVLPIPPEQAGPVMSGFRRVYIEGEVTNLIRGDAGISPAVTYLYDAPTDARGRLPKLKKAQVILFARPGTRPGQIQLIARDAQIPAT
ncbi:MAG: hypothetical protein PSY12_14855, partial [bacterium]|nr:hypothetical protein [bacterium]